MYIKEESEFSSYAEYICLASVINHIYAIYMLLPTNITVHTNLVVYRRV
jgi:hypothetical protein